MIGIIFGMSLQFLGVEMIYKAKKRNNDGDIETNTMIYQTTTLRS